MTNKNKLTMVVCALAILALGSCANSRKYDGDRAMTTTTTTDDRYAYNSGVPYGAAVAPQAGGYATDRSGETYRDRDVRYDDRTAVGYDRRESAAKTHAYDRSQVISFEPRSAVLSEAQKTKLRNLVTSLGDDKIDRIEVAVWSDKAFPRAGTDLSKADRDLAEARIKNINRVLTDDTDISRMDITNYNMAESSNWLARTFRTDDAELKSVFAKETRAPMHREDFNLIYREGAPSKAVLVLVYED